MSHLRRYAADEGYLNGEDVVNEQFDIFLSHNSNDKPVVRERAGTIRRGRRSGIIGEVTRR